MTRLGQLAALARNFGRVRNALATLASLYGGDGTFDALGGLTDAETDWLVGRFAVSSCRVFVEVGALFGFTSRAVAARCPGARVVALDNFSWNPFGLQAEAHERLTRLVLAGSAVELVAGDAAAFLADWREGPESFVFLDGDHRYAAVRREIGLCREAGFRCVSGHDWGSANPRFGVDRAVRETLGEPKETCGQCWLWSEGLTHSA